MAYEKNSDNNHNVQTGIFDSMKKKLTFTVKNYTAEITFEGNDLGVRLLKKVATTKSRYKEEKTEIFGGFKLSDVELTKEVDYSWGKLHSATVKLDSKNTIEMGIKTTRTTNVGNHKENKDGNIKTTIKSMLKQYKEGLATLNKERRKSSCRDEIYICRLTIVEGGFASVDLVLKGKITATGELKIVIELEGGQGVQYKNGNIRYIKSSGCDVNFVADGKVEVTIGPGIEIRLLKQIALINLNLDFGAGANISMTAHLFDAEGHELFSSTAELSADDADELSNEKLYTTAEEIQAFAQAAGGDWKYDPEEWTAGVPLLKGVCVKWSLYPVIRLDIGGKSLVGKIMENAKVSLNIEILGSKSTLAQGHIDFPNNLSEMLDSDNIGDGALALFGINAECTYDYTPWDMYSDEETEDETETEDTNVSETNDGIVVSDKIGLSTMRVFLEPGQSQKLTVTELPEGYNLQDVIAESDNPEIAEFDLKEGIITAKSEGITEILVQTKDGKYKTYCAVSVASSEQVEFIQLAKKISVIGEFMVLEIYTHVEDQNGYDLSYTFVSPKDNLVVARATNYSNEEGVSLYYDEKKYKISSYPKFINVDELPIQYPLSMKRKTLGFNVYENDTYIMKYYGQAATVKKKGIIKNNIGFTVFSNDKEVYMLFKVGFKNKNSHYYCLYNGEMHLIGIVERHHVGKSRATLYVEKDEHLLINLIACTEEIIFVANKGSSEEMMDRTAGLYISRYEEERKLFNAEFIERVKKDAL